MVELVRVDSETLATRLGAFESRGGSLFDPPGIEFVADLLQRAARFGGQTGALLEARAAHHLERLEAAHRAACGRARAALDALDAKGGEATTGLRERLAAGDALGVLQATRRLRSAPRAAGSRSASSGRRYRDALADLQAALAADRTPTPDEQAGLLNAGNLAARLLAEAEAISPSWRRSLVASLFDLGSLMHLPEVQEPRRR